MMCLRKFHIFCLIIYSFFQFYQIFSSLKLVFFDHQSYYAEKFGIQCLVIFHAFGMLTSSLFLIIGSLKSNIKLLLVAILYLIYKFCFMIWQFFGALKAIADCNPKEFECDPNRLFMLYKHILFLCKFIKIQI